MDGELDTPFGLIAIIVVVTILALGGGALLFLRTGDESEGVEILAASGQSQFEQTMEVTAAQVTPAQPEQFVDEQGNHWIRQPDGSMLWWNGTDWQQVDS